MRRAVFEPASSFKFQVFGGRARLCRVADCHPARGRVAPNPVIPTKGALSRIVIPTEGFSLSGGICGSVALFQVSGV